MGISSKIQTPQKSKESSPSVSETARQSKPSMQLVDKRKETSFQKDFQTMASRNSGNFGAEAVFQKKKNETGLPDNLKSGIENLSGIAMDDVQVYRNSSKPAELQAHAYAQGSDIHLAPGQEQHLPHEAWHVVQQKQGRVQPTMQMKGSLAVNDDKSLENEADLMGDKAKNGGNISNELSNAVNDSSPAQLQSWNPVFQLKKLSDEEIENLDREFLDFFRALEEALKPFLPKKSNEETRSSDMQQRGSNMAKSGIKVLKGEENVSEALSEQVTTSDKIDLIKKAAEIGSSLFGEGSSSDQSGGQSSSSQNRRRNEPSSSGSFLDSINPFSSSEQQSPPKKEKEKAESDSPSFLSSLFSSSPSSNSKSGDRNSSQSSGGLLSDLNEDHLRSVGKVAVKGAKAKVMKDEGQRRAEKEVVDTGGSIGKLLGKGIGKVEDFFEIRSIASKGESERKSLEVSLERITTRLNQIEDPEASRQARDLYHEREQTAYNHLHRFSELVAGFTDRPVVFQQIAKEHLEDLEATNPGEPGILGQAKGFFSSLGNTLASGAKSVSNFASETASSAKTKFEEVREDTHRTIFKVNTSVLDKADENL
ncbi:DUF4157 domain-containing protein [Algoriphagus aestuarii]|nr:DUF4157 domain-containing protein [Algoriphagus aestuarii]